MCSLYLSILAVFPPSEPCPSQLIYFLTWVMETAWSAFPGFQPRHIKIHYNRPRPSEKHWRTWCWTFFSFFFFFINNENQKIAFCLVVCFISQHMNVFLLMTKRERGVEWRGKWHHKVVKSESHSALCVRFLTCSGLHIGCLFFIYCCCLFFLSVHLSRLCKFCSIKNHLWPKCLCSPLTLSLSSIIPPSLSS